MRLVAFAALLFLSVAPSLASSSTAFVPTARLGPGGRFEEVYRATQPIGGTVAEVGASGLRLVNGPRAIHVAFAYVEQDGLRVPAAPVRSTRLERDPHGSPKLSLDRGGVDEWFVNGPDGLRQWFKVAQRPAGPFAIGDLRIGLAVDGGWVTATERGVKVRQGRAAFRYRDLRAWDASGRELATRLTGAGRSIELRIDDTGARYPLTIDPIWTLSTELEKSSAYAGSNRFGRALAVSDTTLATSSSDGIQGDDGTVHIFRRAPDGSWSREQEIDSPLPNDTFGDDLAVSGSLLAVTASHDPSQADNTQGEVYVYRRDGTGVWTQEASFSPGLPHSRYYVDLEGDRLVIATHSHLLSYRRQANGTWSPEASQSFPGLGGDLDLEGDRLAVGGPSQQKAYLFEWNGTAWALQHTFQPGIPVDTGGFLPYYGNDVVLRGNTVAVTCPAGEVAGEDVGLVFVYEEAGGTWSETVLSPPPGTTPSDFGASIAIGSDELAVGVRSYPETVGLEGAVFYYQRVGGTWQATQILDEDALSFGNAVGITNHYLAVTASTFGTGYPVFVYSRSRVIPSFPLKARVGGKPIALTVTLTQAAPPGGTTVGLASNNPALTVPASITVAEGETSASVQATTLPVAADTLVTVTASAPEYATGTTTLLVKAPRIVSLTFSLASVHGGEQTVGTVALNGPAPAGGFDVSLSSTSDALFTTPGVTVFAGDSKATFTLQGGTVAVDTPVTLEAVAPGGPPKSAVVTVLPGQVPGLYVVRPSLNIGESTQVFVNIPPAPPGGVILQVKYEGPIFGSPVIGFLEGQSLVPITVFADASTAGLGKISVTYKGLTHTKTIPVSKSILLSLTASPSPVKGGEMVELTVNLEKPAPLSGTKVFLNTANPNLVTLPAYLTVGGGTKTATIFVPTTAVTKSATIAIVAHVQGGGLKGTYLTLNP